MAALSDRVREARADAARAREQSIALRLAIRRQKRDHARRLAISAATAEHVVRAGPRTFRSPWSNLNWHLRTGLGGVLELVER